MVPSMKMIVTMIVAAALFVSTSAYEQFHLSLTGDPSQMAVMFVSAINETSTTAGPPVLLFGPAGKPLSQHANVTTHTYTGGTTPPWHGLIHTATMTGLQSGAEYTYQIQGEDTQHRYYAARPATYEGPVTFATWGDMGTSPVQGGAALNDHVVASLVEGPPGASEDRPDVVILQGDIAYDKGDPIIWDNFFRQVEGFASRVPLMTCPGNEDHADNFSSYRNRLHLPGQEHGATEAPWWYSFEIGAHVHVASITVEQSHDGGAGGYWNGTAQFAWLERDLAAAAARNPRPWIVALGHRPLYCSSSDYYDCEMWGPRAREALEPLFCKYGVDMYLSGHVHSYERTYPVCHGYYTAKNYSDAQAPTHVMVGSGGAGLTHHWKRGPPPAWSAKRIIDYGVGLVTANATALRFRFARTGQNGTRLYPSTKGYVIADEFTLRRGPGARARVVPAVDVRGTRDIPTHTPTVSPTGCVTNHHGAGWASSNCDAVGTGAFFFMVVGIPVIALLLAYFYRLCRPRVVTLKQGDQVAVYWRSESEWFRGAIENVNLKENTCAVRYDDGDYDPVVAVDDATFVKLDDVSRKPPSSQVASYQYQQLGSAAALD